MGCQTARKAVFRVDVWETLSQTFRLFFARITQNSLLTGPSSSLTYHLSLRLRHRYQRQPRSSADDEHKKYRDDKASFLFTGTRPEHYANSCRILLADELSSWTCGARRLEPHTWLRRYLCDSRSKSDRAHGVYASPPQFTLTTVWCVERSVQSLW